MMEGPNKTIISHLHPLHLFVLICLLTPLKLRSKMPNEVVSILDRAWLELCLRCTVYMSELEMWVRKTPVQDVNDEN